MNPDGGNLQKSTCNCPFCDCDQGIQEFLIELVDRFFAKQKLHRAWKSRFLCGDKIPKSWLREHSRLSSLIQSDLDEVIKSVYSWTERQPVPLSNRKDAPWDIILVNEALQLLVSEGVPQKYAAGMLSMYLELCQGVFVD
jgi:hypothetical protein